jgi:hypothetical protein
MKSMKQNAYAVFIGICILIAVFSGGYMVVNSGLVGKVFVMSAAVAFLCIRDDIQNKKSK